MKVTRRTFVLSGASTFAALLAGCGSKAEEETTDETTTDETAVEETAENAGSGYEVTFGATVTDAGEYVDRMTIDYGDGTISGVEDDTYTVFMTSTVDYGEAKGEPYAYYDASVPLEVVKTETDGGKVTVFFNQSQAPVLTWLAEGRNYPGVLAFTIEQAGELTLRTKDGRDLPIDGEYTCAASSYADLDCAEVAAFEDVQDEINYQLHKGTNDKLIVWFHGNGEGDFPVKDTNNNIAQVLANRGSVAWVSEEAQAVFGDATVMAFQAPTCGTSPSRTACWSPATKRSRRSSPTTASAPTRSTSPAAPLAAS